VTILTFFLNRIMMNVKNVATQMLVNVVVVTSIVSARMNNVHQMCNPKRKKSYC